MALSWSKYYYCCHFTYEETEVPAMGHRAGVRRSQLQNPGLCPCSHHRLHFSGNETELKIPPLGATASFFPLKMKNIPPSPRSIFPLGPLKNCLGLNFYSLGRFCYIYHPIFLLYHLCLAPMNLWPKTSQMLNEQQKSFSLDNSHLFSSLPSAFLQCIFLKAELLFMPYFPLLTHPCSLDPNSLPWG